MFLSFIMLREEIVEFLGEDWTALNGQIRDALKSDVHLLQAVNDDIISHSGKMLRPLMALLVARIVGGKTNGDAVKVAAATELLHNATLLHDDVADKSTLRRGKPTLCSKIGPQAAVLVGDFWLARAMELVVEVKDHQEAIVDVFSNAMTCLAEGEMLQLEKASGERTERKDYLRIIYCKTASLFETACLSAAIASGADEGQLAQVKKYAYSLGIAFQIKDDILDYVGDAALGKPVGIDLKEQKITLPLLCALEGSPRDEEIRKMLFDIHNHPEYCEQIRTFVFEHQGVEKAEVILERYIQDAVDALNCFGDGREKEYLTGIARYNTVRKS